MVSSAARGRSPRSSVRSQRADAPEILFTARFPGRRSGRQRYALIVHNRFEIPLFAQRTTTDRQSEQQASQQPIAGGCCRRWRLWTLGLGCSLLLMIVFNPRRADASSPILKPLRQLQAKIPVVVVPGVIGTKLRERATGKLLWGRGTHLLRPKDGGYAVARPISLPPEAEARVEAAGLVE